MDSSARAVYRGSEAVQTCPYCGKQYSKSALYGHILFSDDEAHGGLWKTPDDFDQYDVETISEREPAAERGPDQHFRCKWCNEDFARFEELEEHVSHQVGDSNHPTGATGATSALRIPASTSTAQESESKTPPRGAPGAGTQPFQQWLRDHGLYEDDPESDPGGFSKARPAVPSEPLYELLDELRSREAQSGAYYMAAKLLQQTIEENERLLLDTE